MNVFLILHGFEIEAPEAEVVEVMLRWLTGSWSEGLVQCPRSGLQSG
jgi:hypothetical protein